jgi:hypothetical protein
MQGGSQAHLVAAADGRAYVTKLSNSPQHARPLVGEVVCAALLRRLGITTPDVRLILITQEFIDNNPGFYVEHGNGRRAAEPGVHFGSAFPGDHRLDVVYDYLPDPAFDLVENRAEFAGILAFDVWVAQSDARQAIFSRDALRSGPRRPRRRKLRAYMVDHGMAFGGAMSDFSAGPAKHTLYKASAAYRGIRSLDDFEPWLSSIESMPEAVIQDALRQAPPCWTDAHPALLEMVAEQLLRRRHTVRNSLYRLIRSAREAFPDWVDPLPGQGAFPASIQQGKNIAVKAAQLGASTLQPQCCKDCLAESPRCPFGSAGPLD